jgi:hypothetical protein
MSENSDGKWTRRRFLEAIGMAGGAAAVYETMTALGLINVPEAFARQPLPPNSGTGKSVVILGAGVETFDANRGGRTGPFPRCPVLADGIHVEAVEGLVAFELAPRHEVAAEEPLVEKNRFLLKEPRARVCASLPRR